jgi:hypothetical protein
MGIEYNNLTLRKMFKMKINIFEGGRRILLVLQLCILMIFVFLAFSYKPYASLNLETTSPNNQFIISNHSCDISHDKSKLITKNYNNIAVRLNLCFRSEHYEKTGSQLITYFENEYGMWGGDKNSEQVADYTNRRAQDFVIDEDIVKAYLELIEKDKKEHIWGLIKAAVVIIAILQALSFFVGWVFRGFLGIPIKQDKIN